MKIKIKLHWQIIISLILAVFLFSILGEKILFTIFFGDIFIKLLKMIIIPLIVLSIITGISSTGNSKSLTRIGIKTFIFYLTTSFIAISIGFFIFLIKEIITIITINLSLNYIFSYFIIFMIPFLIGLYQVIKIENE